MSSELELSVSESTIDPTKSDRLEPPSIPKPDFNTRLFVWLMLLVKFIRPTYTLQGLRKRVAKSENKKVRLPVGISHRQETLAGMKCDRLLNPGAEFIVLHYYGGAFCVRMPGQEMPSIASFCSRINAEAYLPWYRLAPEHKFPAAQEDCLAAYQELLERGVAPQQIILSGTSAGGGNVLSVLAMLKRAQLPMPACALLSSPAGDAMQVGDSWRENARRDPFFKLADIAEFSDLAISEEQKDDPLLNVSRMDDFSGYPPLYFSASSDEILRDVSTLAHEKALSAGVPSQLDIFQGGFHCMPIMMRSRQSQVIWKRIEHFVRLHTETNK